MLPTVIISLARFMYMAITLVFSNSILGAISAFFGTPYVACKSWEIFNNLDLD